MIKSLLRISFIFVFLFISCNKQGELQGSVFIVTQGAQNIKLGLVKVTAIPENEIKKFVEQKKSVINGETNKLKSDFDLLKPEIAKKQKEFDEIKRNYDEIVAQRDNLKSREQSLNLNFNPYLANEDPYFSEYETEEMKAERIKHRQLKKQLDTIRKQIAAYEPKISEASKIMSGAKSRLENSQSNLLKITDKLASYVQASFLFDGLPEGKNKAVTDAEGKFTMKLPSGKYALVASSERRVISKTEEYYWLVWVDIDGIEPKQVMLTNQNLLGEDSEDTIFKIKELIPSSESPDKDQNNSSSV